MGLEKERGQGKRRRAVGVLDIGTTKVACLIAETDSEPRLSAAPGDDLRILGVGHQGARGVKSGVITDLDEAEDVVRATVARAERMAGIRLDEVRLSVSCGRLRSAAFAASTEVEGGIVSEADLARLLAGGRAYAEREGRTLVHMNRISVRLDGAPGGRDPSGMAARALSADLHAVTADEAPLRNLLLVVERCHLAVSHLFPAPLASALAATSEEERRLGVTLIDIGGGTTTLALFAEGELIHVDAAAMGGHHITFDIARALHAPLAEAERIKALYGTVVSAQSDGHDEFSYQQTGEDDGGVNRMTKAELADIIRPRADDFVRHIRERLEACALFGYASGRIVLTGGTSQLAGLGDFAAHRLGWPVRVAPPRSISGLPPAVAGPAFSGAVGLLLARMPDALDAGATAGLAPQGYLDRVGEWLRRGF